MEKGSKKSAGSRAGGAALGIEAFAAISAVEGLKLSAEGRKRVTGPLSPEKRRAEVLKAYAGSKKPQVTPGGYEIFEDPYCDSGADCLRNKAGIRDAARLEAFALEMSSIRATEPLPKGRFGAAHYRRVHRHLFQDVYTWAGRRGLAYRLGVNALKAHRCPVIARPPNQALPLFHDLLHTAVIN